MLIFEKYVLSKNEEYFTIEKIFKNYSHMLERHLFDLILVKKIISFINSNKDNIEHFDLYIVMSKIKGNVRNAYYLWSRNYQYNNIILSLQKIHYMYKYLKFKEELCKKYDVDIRSTFKFGEIVYLLFIFDDIMKRIVEKGEHVKLRSENNINR